MAGHGDFFLTGQHKALIGTEGDAPEVYKMMRVKEQAKRESLFTVLSNTRTKET